MAGAYCNFCGFRCFLYRIVPDGPSKGWGGHMATCPRGMALDLEKLGHTHLTAVAAELAAETDEQLAARLGLDRPWDHPDRGCDGKWLRALAIREHCRASRPAGPPAPQTPETSTKVFTWDFDDQPPLGEILGAARDMPGPWFWCCPDGFNPTPEIRTEEAGQ